jgi:hypothetical protein
VRVNPSQTWRDFGIFAHANLVAASLWEAQCGCSLAARHVARRATATESSCDLDELEPPSKETRDRYFRGV